MIFNVTFIVYHFQICMVCFWVYSTPLLYFVYSCILNTFITIDFFCLANWQSKTSILFSLFTSIFSLGPLLINTSLETSCPVAPIIFWEFLLVSIYNNLERVIIFTLLMLPINMVYQCKKHHGQVLSWDFSLASRPAPVRGYLPLSQDLPLLSPLVALYYVCGVFDCIRIQAWPFQSKKLPDSLPAQGLAEGSQVHSSRIPACLSKWKNRDLFPADKGCANPIRRQKSLQWVLVLSNTFFHPATGPFKQANDVMRFRLYKYFLWLSDEE